MIATSGNKERPRSLRIALAALVGLVMIAALLPTDAAGGRENNVGSHAFKVNVIARPNGWNGDDTGSNGKTLFISLKTARVPACETDSQTDTSGKGTILSEVPDGGQRIKFSAGDSFLVKDRDATDGSAEIQLPANVAGFEVYVRVLGGNNRNFAGCLDADAYGEFYDEELQAVQYYYVGHLDANRKSGVPQKISVTELFTDADGNALYADPYYNYFWDVANNGLRNMQIIFYAT